MDYLVLDNYGKEKSRNVSNSNESVRSKPVSKSQNSNADKIITKKKTNKKKTQADSFNNMTPRSKFKHYKF